MWYKVLIMKKKKLLRRIAEYLFLIIGVPMFLLAAIEGIIRVAGINTEIVKSDEYKIGIPMWALNDANLMMARNIYKPIIDDALPVSSAEWMQYFEEAKHIHYKMKANISVKIFNTVNRIELGKGIRVLMRSNSIGFRTHEIPKTKPAGVYRIFLLGDSTTFGWGVDQEDRFSNLLEEKLNAAQDSTQFEVYNFGIPGYSSYHGKKLFDHYVLRYDPDMMILTFGANDGTLIPESVKKYLRNPPAIENLTNFLGNFKTYKLMRKIILGIYNPFEEARKKNQKEEKWEAFVTIEEFQTNLSYIIDEGKKRGIETALLSLCCSLDYLAKLSSIGRRKGIPMIDGMYVLLHFLPSVQEGELYPELALYYKNLYGEQVLKDRRILYVTSDTCHPNKIGHRIIASTLFDRVFIEKVLP